MKIGSIVRHSTAWCRNVQCHNPPINGIVIDDSHAPLLRVWFCDEDPESAGNVLSSNLEYHGAEKTITDTMRQLLVDEGRAAMERGKLCNSTSTERSYTEQHGKKTRAYH